MIAQKSSFDPVISNGDVIILLFGVSESEQRGQKRKSVLILSSSASLKADETTAV